jgi:putative exporter of polyketide antibiotics
MMPAISVDIMNKLSIARLAIISSLLYAVGFIGYVVNRGSEVR